MSTLKKYVISRLHNVPLVEGAEDNSVIVMTPAGTYIGKPVSDKDESKTDSFWAELFFELAKDYRQDNQIAENVPLDGNDGFLVLKDVQLQANGSIIKMPFVVLFFDQIVGITIGNI